uniref:ATP synthase subunit n=1 Tax=Plectus sambesii TaxID=2011161 RepID=A0A914WPY8_9BILA
MALNAAKPSRAQKLAHVGRIFWNYYEPQNKLAKLAKYVKAEMMPPSPAELPEIQRRLGNIVKGFETAKWKQMPVKEAWLNTLVVMEVCFWFWFGEMIGRRHFIGYVVPADYCLEDDKPSKKK